MLLGAKSNVPDYLAAADLFIHSARSETAGNAILEALVAGLPVIVTACCGFAFHVENAKAGIVVDDSPYQQENLNAALAKAMHQENRELWHKNACLYKDANDLYSRPNRILEILSKRNESARPTTL
jgi:UDP-glucose:(heptosyl)LPS alpha-1,3-glucosyltransferase